MDSASALGLHSTQAGPYLRELLDGVPVGVITANRDGLILSSNSVACDILRTNELVGLPVFDLFADVGTVKAVVGASFEEGEPSPRVVEQEAGGEIRAIEVSARLLTNEPRGSPVAMLVLQDVTRQLKAERALQRAVLDREFLTNAGAELGKTLDYHATLGNLARLAVTYLADWCTINVLTEDEAIERVAVAHADPDREALVEALHKRHPHDPSATTGVPQVLRTGSSELHTKVDDDFLERTANNPDYLRIVKELGLRSAMIVPLLAHEEVLGTITFVSSGPGRVYDHGDLELAEELGRRSGVAVYNSRLFKSVTDSRRRYKNMAQTLQATLLPPELPQIPGFELGALYRSAARGMEVGGDFYDLFESGDGGWGLVMGDVQGHGAEAAAVTAAARYTLRAIAMRLPRPSHVLYQVNRAILRQHGGDRFLSAVFARVEPGTRSKITICCAGHPLPMVVRADGGVETVGSSGMLLGLFQAPELHERIIELAPSETLVLFTDGVIEAGAPRHMLGEEGLRQLLARCRGLSAQEVVDMIGELLLTWQDEAGHRDDCAVLVLRRIEGGIP